MFRELTRYKQAITKDQCEEILKNELRGVLSVIGDDGYPYAFPMNHYYEDGILYFHSGSTGHKIDAIKQCDKASFCVIDKGVKDHGSWAFEFKSVIVFGRISFIDDHDEAIEISRKLSRKFTSDEGYIDREITNFGKSVLCFKLTSEFISGKTVKES